MTTTVPSTRPAPGFGDVAPGRPIISGTWGDHAQRLHYGYARKGVRIPLVIEPIITSASSYVRTAELDGLVGVWRPGRVCDGDVYRIELRMYAADADVRLNLRDINGSASLSSTTAAFAGAGAWRSLVVSVAAADALDGGASKFLTLDLEVRRHTTQATILQAYARAAVLTGAQLP